VILIIATVNYARDPAHHLRTAQGQKEPALGRRPERVPAGIQQPANLLLKGRNPSGVLGIEVPGKVDEVFKFRTSFNNNDLDAGRERSV
jgi:hypothetical protein